MAALFEFAGVSFLPNGPVALICGLIAVAMIAAVGALVSLFLSKKIESFFEGIGVAYAKDVAGAVKGVMLLGAAGLALSNFPALTLPELIPVSSAGVVITTLIGYALTFALPVAVLAYLGAASRARVPK